MDSLRGQLLVAGPRLQDPNFHRTVILVCEHDEGGALGLVLNRRTPLQVGASVPGLDELVDPADALWSGGPVQPSSIVLLAEFVGPAEALMVTERIGLVLDGADLDALGASTSRARAFAGYAGWGPGQLDAELEEEAWIVAPGSPEDAFSEDPSRLWGRALERLGGPYSLLATMPPDPSLN